jgi:hypothetical protein
MSLSSWNCFRSGLKKEQKKSEAVLDIPIFYLAKNTNNILIYS